MTYANTTLLGLNQPTTGSESGVWGDDVNNGFTQLVDLAVAGTNNITQDSDITLAISNGSNSSSFTSTATNSTVAQYAILNCTGARTAARNIIAPASSKTFLVINGTTGGYAITIKKSAGTGVSIAAGETAYVYYNIVSGDYAKGTTSVVSAAGSNTYVQYNSSGSFAGSANFTFNGTTVTMANDASIHGLTVGLGGGSVSTNTAVGASALAANTSGVGNTAFGNNVMPSETSGAYNTGIGDRALNATTTGSENTAVGQASLYANTTGSYNVSVGRFALGANTTSSSNTAVGYQAAYSNSTGSRITAIGYGAGYSSTITDAGVFIGHQAGYSNTTGQYNVAVGGYEVSTYPALYSNTTGNYNTALGAGTLAKNTTASNNTAVGYQSLYSNTTANGNTAIGVQALSANTTASQNTAVGYQAGYTNTGSSLTAVGYKALFASTTNGYSTAIGWQAGKAATTGYIVAIGADALALNTTGNANTAIGGFDGTNEGALYSNTTGSYNTAIGPGSLQSNTTASNNTAVGYQAGYLNTGAQNTFLGYQAGYANTTNGYSTYVGYQAGANTDGRNNTFIGLQSGYLVSSGYKHTIIGGYNGNQGGLDIRTASNYIVLSDGDGNPRIVGNNVGDIITGAYLGAGLQNVNGVTLNNNGNSYAIVNHVSGTNTGTYYVAFGYNGSAIGSITQSGTTGVLYNITSDQRLKENIVDAPSADADIDAIKVRSFDFISDKSNVKYGFIAQELVTVAPYAVHQPENSEEIMGVDYSKLVPMMIKEIQSLRARLKAANIA